MRKRQRVAIEQYQQVAVQVQISEALKVQSRYLTKREFYLNAVDKTRIRKQTSCFNQQRLQSPLRSARTRAHSYSRGQKSSQVDSMTHLSDIAVGEVKACGLPR